MKPRFQFSLRTLLLIGAVVAACCWVACRGELWISEHRFHVRDEYYDDDGKLLPTPHSSPASDG